MEHSTSCAIAMLRQCGVEDGEPPPPLLAVEHADVESIEEPEHLLCPISLTLFADPVIILSGHTYERSAIMRFWANRPLANPLGSGNELLRSAQMIINYNMRSQVDQWLDTASPAGYTPRGWAAPHPTDRSAQHELDQLAAGVEAAARAREAKAVRAARAAEIDDAQWLAEGTETVYIVGALPGDGCVHCAAYRGAYRLQAEAGLVNGRHVYYQLQPAGTAAQDQPGRSLWYAASTGYWHCGPAAYGECARGKHARSATTHARRASHSPLARARARLPAHVSTRARLHAHREPTHPHSPAEALHCPFYCVCPALLFDTGLPSLARRERTVGEGCGHLGCYGPRTPLPERLETEWMATKATGDWLAAPGLRCLAGAEGEAALALLAEAEGHAAEAATLAAVAAATAAAAPAQDAVTERHDGDRGVT